MSKRAWIAAVALLMGCGATAGDQQQVTGRGGKADDGVGQIVSDPSLNFEMKYERAQGYSFVAQYAAAGCAPECHMRISMADQDPDRFARLCGACQSQTEAFAPLQPTSSGECPAGLVRVDRVTRDELGIPTGTQSYCLVQPGVDDLGNRGQRWFRQVLVSPEAEEVAMPGPDGREGANAHNHWSRLHPDLGDRGQFDTSLTQCRGNENEGTVCAGGLRYDDQQKDVFASQWWPQSRNGIAWRWTGGGSEAYDDVADRENLSPAEKYDLLFNRDSVGAQPDASFRPRCGSGTCTSSQNVDNTNRPAATVACNDASAQFCVNYAWMDKQKGCPSNPENGHRCTPIFNRMTNTVGPATKWEMENHGKFQNVQPDSWWGHCNGWASYATAEEDKFPRRDICVRPKQDAGTVELCAQGWNEDGQFTGTCPADCVLVRMGDVEALMSEVYFSDAATFSGQRCNTQPDDMERDVFERPTESACRDINPATFHIAVTQLLGAGATPFTGDQTQRKLAFVIDHNFDYQVWNFPLVKFRFNSVQEITASNCQQVFGIDGQTTAEGCAAAAVANGEQIDGYQMLDPAPGTSKWIAVSMQYGMVSDGVSAQYMRVRADRRPVDLHWTEMNYILELDASYNILGGEWIRNHSFQWGQDSKGAHPDFLWMAIKPSASSDDTDVQDGDNPYLNYKHIKNLIKCANDISTCASAVQPPTDPVNPPTDPVDPPFDPNQCTLWMVTSSSGLIAKCGVGPGSFPLQNLTRTGEVASAWMRNPQYGDLLELDSEIIFDGTYNRRKLNSISWYEAGGNYRTWDFNAAAAARGCTAGIYVASGQPSESEDYVTCYNPF